MRSINTFMIIALAIAFVLVAGHYAALAVWHRVHDARHRVPRLPPPVLCLNPPRKQPAYIDADDWLRRARIAAEQIAAERGEVTVDMVWEVCPPVPGMDRRLMMAAFPRSDWEVVDRRKSEREINHGRLVAVWRRKVAE